MRKTNRGVRVLLALMTLIGMVLHTPYEPKE